MFVWPLGLAAVYCMLENRIWLSSALITVVISLHVVGDFILFPILFFFIVFNKGLSNNKLAALILPVVYLVIKYLTTSIQLPSGQDAAPLYELAKMWAGLDTYFLDHPTPVIICFAASFIIFPVFWWCLRASEATHPNLLPFLKALWLASLLVVLFFVFYTTFGYRFFYYPPLIMLTPVRGMNYFAFLFYLSSFVLIFQNTKITNIEKISIMLALVLFHLKSLGGILYPSVILIGGVLVSRISSKKLLWFKRSESLIPIGLILIMALTGAQIVKGGKYFHSFNSHGWEHLSRWTQTVEADESVWNAYKKVQNMKTDFTMLPFYRSPQGKLIGDNTYLNIFAKKSNFIADGSYHFIFNSELLEEHKVREKAYNEVFVSTESHRSLSEWARNVLRSRKVTVVVPKRDSAGLKGWTKKLAIGSFYMLQYSE